MESPHEDEQWRELYENVEITDEMQLFRKMGVFEKVDRKEVRSSGGKIITTKWVDTDKGHGGYRSRLVGRELKRDKCLDFVCANCPFGDSEAARSVLCKKSRDCLTSVALTFTRHANVPYSLRFQMKTGRSAMSTGLGV